MGLSKEVVSMKRVETGEMSDNTREIGGTHPRPESAGAPG